MGLIDYIAFRDEATKYYKAVLDSASGGPHIMRTHNNIYMYEHSIVLKAGPGSN